MNNIYIPYDNGLNYDECYLISTSIQYKDCILEEIIFNNEFVAELKEKQTKEQTQNSIDFDKEIEKIVNKAKNEKEKDIDYNKSSAQKLKGIKRNRTVEKTINREYESFNFNEEDQNQPNRVAEVIEIVKSTDIKEESSGDSRLLEMIRRKRNEKK